MGWGVTGFLLFLQLKHFVTLKGGNKKNVKEQFSVCWSSVYVCVCLNQWDYYLTSLSRTLHSYGRVQKVRSISSGVLSLDVRLNSVRYFSWQKYQVMLCCLETFNFLTVLQTLWFGPDTHIDWSFFLSKSKCEACWHKHGVRRFVLAWPDWWRGVYVEFVNYQDFLTMTNVRTIFPPQVSHSSGLPDLECPLYHWPLPGPGSHNALLGGECYVWFIWKVTHGNNHKTWSPTCQKANNSSFKKSTMLSKLFASPS